MMEYIVVIDVDEPGVLESLKTHCKIISVLPRMDNLQTLLVEAKTHKAISELRGVKNIGPNRTVSLS